MLTNIVIIIIVSVIVQFLLRRDLAKGLAAAIFFLVLLPVEVRIDMPGAIPQLTAHRVILLIVLFNVLPKIRRLSLLPVSRIVLLLCLTGVARLFSCVTAIDPADSFKDVTGFWIETVLYFVLFAAALEDRRAVEKIAWSTLGALVIIAGIGTVEKYTGRNLAACVVSGMADFPNTVSATFRHRILFGYAMAMGIPLALYLKERAATKWQKRLAMIGFIILPAACYFSNSRGPWVGCALGACLMVVLGGRGVRRTALITAVLAAVVLIVRPGVRDTIVDLWHQSFSDDSVKGESVSYRKKLWFVAYSELTKSPGKTLFGYGGHSTEMLDLSSYFDRGAGGLAAMLGYTSWDSQFAADFMQFGFVGFGVEAVLYLWILFTLFKTWRQSDKDEKDLAAACVAVAGVFVWAMFTVAIFNPQLEFMFWTVIVISGKLHHLPQSVPVHEVGATVSEDTDEKVLGTPETSGP